MIIFSGHFVVIMNVCLLFQDIYTNYCKSSKLHTFTKYYLWSAAVLCAFDMIKGRHHYTVDVYVAGLVCTLFYYGFITNPMSIWYIDLVLFNDKYKREFEVSYINRILKRFGINTKRKLIISVAVVLLISVGYPLYLAVRRS